MLVRAGWENETRVLILSGRFDKSARVPVERALAAGEGRPWKQVVMDFSRVSSMDSAGIGKLLLLYHSLRKKGVALTVINPKPSVEGLLHLVSLATIIPIIQEKPEVRSVPDLRERGVGFYLKLQRSEPEMEMIEP
ncbi:MAG: STAS domain-containing protein [Nitrospirota bacterium]|nr:STAS domain-containing protein [Nitrospirota bacterium]MDH5699291.1 STAS domain-containing protein [Nitrospirota bacterium]